MFNLFIHFKCSITSNWLQTQLLSLLCLGEIGRRKDLSNHPNIEGVVIRSFQSPSEEIKAAASYALGNIAVGNLALYLPFILSQIDRQAKLQYLLLHSLKEVKISSLVKQLIPVVHFNVSCVDFKVW